MTDRNGTLEDIASPTVLSGKPSTVVSWAAGLMKALIPWAVVIVIWEAAAANGWSGAVLFPPPSSFLRYAVESDFRVGFGRDAMSIPMGIWSVRYGSWPALLWDSPPPSPPES